jgi:hypothetical protein
MSFKHKNNKFSYYFANYARLLVPEIFYRVRLNNQLKKLKKYDTAYIESRVNYYNKLVKNQILPADTEKISDLRIVKHYKTYFLDSKLYTRFFNPKLCINFLFGDITEIPDTPSIVKSRPIHGGDNTNSVILKLDIMRHFLFTKDKTKFVDKKNMLVGRGKINQLHRARFMEMYFGHPLCNIGNVTNKENYTGWLVNRLTISEQLKFKFILCLEGNDVASNLKWVMSSNSIAVMPKPKYETWFMEGTLIENYHYIRIKDDYSDLEERLNYYIEHTDEALKIINHAHQYVEPFKNKGQEDIIAFLVIQKYFQKTGQLQGK